MNYAFTLGEISPSPPPSSPYTPPWDLKAQIPASCLKFHPPGPNLSLTTPNPSLMALIITKGPNLSLKAHIQPQGQNLSLKLKIQPEAQIPAMKLKSLLLAQIPALSLNPSPKA